jgi:hypothetical protein
MIPSTTAILQRFTASGPRCGNPTPFSPLVVRSAIPTGATACSRPSPACSSSCSRFCTGTPRAVICPTCRAYGSVRQPIAKPARDSRGASLTSCWRASAAPCSPVLRATGGGQATACFWLIVRDAPCPIPWCDRRLSASRPSRALDAAFPWRLSWGYSMHVPVDS